MSNLYIFIPFVTFISVLFIFAYVYGQRKKSIVNESFLLFTFFMMSASFLDFIWRFEAFKAYTSFIYQMIIPILLLLGFLFLNFVFTLINKPRNVFYWLLLTISSVSVIIFQFVPPLSLKLFPGMSTPVAIPSLWLLPSFIISSIVTPGYGLILCAQHLKSKIDIVLYRQLRLVITGALLSTPVAAFSLFIGPFILNNYASINYSSICILVNTLFMFRAVQRHFLLSVNIEQIENAFNRLFENSHDAVILLDCNGTAIQINNSAHKLLGTNNTSIDRYALEKIIPEYNFLRNRTDTSATLTVNNETKYIQFSQSLVKNNDISFGKLLIIRDVTLHKKTEQFILDTKNMESIGQLAGGIAHDFNNLLCGIVSNLSLAKQEVSPMSKAAELISLSESTALNARDLTRQLLTFSKGDSRKIETFDIIPLISEICHFMTHGSHANIIHNLPKTTVLISADKGQIRQVFQNLILNAIESMPERGLINIHGKVIDQISENSVCINSDKIFQISITDQGCGIPSANLSRIFEPYFTTKPTGNGLGLAIVNSIISKINGNISVNSQQGKGSTFTVRIPVINAYNNPATPITETVSAKPGRVLIMDDYPTVRLSLAMLLKRMGYAVDQASSGNQAIEIYDKTTIQENISYQIVITDLTVPGAMGGKDLAAELHKRNPDLPIIVSSGYSDEIALSRYRDFGFAGVLHKPYSQEELQDILLSSLVTA